MASYELVTGQRSWEISIAGISTPYVVGEWVYAMTDDGKLLCVARGSGKVRWLQQLARFRIETEKKKKDPIRWTGPILAGGRLIAVNSRSEEHTSELQSLMRISYAVFCLKKQK